MLLPHLVSLVVERQFEAFGCKHVNVVVESPGLRRTVIPLVSFQKDMGAETARLTIRGLTLEYQLPQLLRGFLREGRIEELHLDLMGVPTDQSPDLPDEPSMAAVAVALDALSEFLLDPLVGRLALTNATIFREQATGPFRRLKISGALRNENGTLNGAVSFQGMEGEPYTLRLTMNPRGRMKVLLHSGRGIAESLLDLESTVQVSSQTGLHWQGSLNANLKRATPFLALLLPLGSDLEQVDGVVAFQGEGVTEQIGSFHRMLRDASTRLHGVFQASVELPAWGEISEEIAVTLSGELNAHSTAVALTLFPFSSVRGRVHPLERLLKGTPFLGRFKEKEPIRLQLQDKVNGRFSLDPDDLRWTLDGPIRVQYGMEHSPIGLNALVTNASGLFSDPLSTEANMHCHFWGALSVLEPSPIQVQDIRWNVTGKVAFQKQAIHADVGKGSWMKTGPLRFEQGTANFTEFHVSRTVPVSVELSSKKWNIGPTTVHIKLPLIHWGGQRVTIEKVGLRVQEASGEGNKWQTTGTAKFLGLSSVLNEFVPPKTNFVIGFDATSAVVKAGVVAETVDQSVKVTGLVNHDLLTNQGVLRATMALRPFSSSERTLSRLITPWNYPFDFTAGRLGLSTVVTWSVDDEDNPGSVNVRQGEVTITAKDLDGYYEKILLEDVNTTMKLAAASLDDLTMVVPAHVSMGRVDSGIEIENIAFTLRLGRLGFGHGEGRPAIEIKDFSGHTLGGHVSSARIYVDPARPPSLFTLKFEGLQLDRLFQLEQQKGLEGTGVLDGSIPITLNGETITIRDGQMAARPPGGMIRFEPLEETRQRLVQAKPEMVFVLRVLENFRYDALRAEVNYHEDGTLLLATRLEGRNPDMKESPPIHVNVNVNVEENLPALLQSVQVVNGLEKQLGNVFRQSLF